MADSDAEWSEKVRQNYYYAFNLLEDGFDLLRDAPPDKHNEKGEFLLEAQNSLVINLHNLIGECKKHFSQERGLEPGADSVPEATRELVTLPAVPRVGCATPPGRKAIKSGPAIMSPGPSKPMQSLIPGLGRVTLSANPIPITFQGSPTTTSSMSNTSRGDKSRVRISPSPFLRGVDATDNLGGVGALLSLRIITEGGNKTLYLTFVEPATARTAISRIHQREFPAIPSAASIQLLPAEGFDLIQLPTNRLTRRIKLAGGGLFRIISPQNFYTEARKFAGPDGIEDINQPSTGETVMTFASVYLANGYVDYLRTKKKHGLLQGVRVEFSFLKDKCGNLTNPQPWFKTF